MFKDELHLVKLRADCTVTCNSTMFKDELHQKLTYTLLFVLVTPPCLKMNYIHTQLQEAGEQLVTPQCLKMNYISSRFEIGQFACNSTMFKDELHPIIFSSV